MNQSGKIVLSKLLQKSRDDRDTKTHIYVQTNCTADAIEFLLADSYSNKCYKSRISNDEIRETALDLEIEYEKCYDHIYTALTTNLAPGFISEINADECSYKLINQLHFDMVYVEAKLREVPNNHEMLEHAIELIGSNTQGTAQETTESNAKAEVVFTSAENERKLLKKFAVLLNTKKAKIEELQDKLGQLLSPDDSNGSSDEELLAMAVAAEQSAAGISAKRASNSSQTKSKKAKRVIESDDSDENEDDDDGAGDYDAMTPPMTIDTAEN